MLRMVPTRIVVVGIVIGNAEVSPLTTYPPARPPTMGRGAGPVDMLRYAAAGSAGWKAGA